MNKKKDFWLSIIGLVIILIGAIGLIVMDFPVGLLIILPSAIPHIYRLFTLKKNCENGDKMINNKIES